MPVLLPPLQTIRKYFLALFWIPVGWLSFRPTPLVRRGRRNPVVSETAAPVGHGTCGDVSRRRGGLQALRRFPMMTAQRASYASQII
jgi:hypothetical protein